MVKHDAPQIKSVNIQKEGRFWSLTVDSKLLAIVLYKRGAEATQELLQRLAGLPVTVPPEKEEEPKVPKTPASKKTEPAKTKPASYPKAKPPLKKPEAEAAHPALAPTPAALNP